MAVLAPSLCVLFWGNISHAFIEKKDNSKNSDALTQIMVKITLSKHINAFQ